MHSAITCRCSSSSRSDDDNPVFAKRCADAFGVDIGRVEQAGGTFVSLDVAPASLKLFSTTQVYDLRTVQPANGDD